MGEKVYCKMQLSDSSKKLELELKASQPLGPKTWISHLVRLNLVANKMVTLRSVKRETKRGKLEKVIFRFGQKCPNKYATSI